MADQIRKELLMWASRQAEVRPLFWGSILKQFKELRSLDEQGLAAYLDCSVASLSVIGLCRAPKTSSAHFREDLEEVAEYVGVKSEKLVQVVREVESNLAIGGSSVGPPQLANTQSFMLAARDKPGPKRKK
jgi:hypothetical protein